MTSMLTRRETPRLTYNDKLRLEQAKQEHLLLKQKKLEALTTQTAIYIGGESATSIHEDAPEYLDRTFGHYPDIADEHNNLHDVPELKLEDVLALHDSVAVNNVEEIVENTREQETELKIKNINSLIETIKGYVDGHFDEFNSQLEALAGGIPMESMHEYRTIEAASYFVESHITKLQMIRTELAMQKKMLLSISLSLIDLKDEMDPAIDEFIGQVEEALEFMNDEIYTIVQAA